MEEYYNLTSPLNNYGLFEGDEKSNVTNEYVSKLPTFAEQLELFRLSSQMSFPYSGVSQYHPNSGAGIKIDLTKYKNDMSLSFPQICEQEGIKLTVTSSLRPGARTKSGHPSNHSKKTEWGHSAAVDIVPKDKDFENLKKQIYNNPRIVAWLINHKVGILEETTKDVMSKTGATGPHFHVGPDLWAIRMSSKYIDYNNGLILGQNQYTGKTYKISDVGWKVDGAFQSINTYKVDPDTKVILTKEDLWKQDTGLSQIVHNSRIIGNHTSLGKGTIASKHNNPCNISPSSGDFGYIGSSTVADGQKHGGYRTIVDGLASTMKLLTRSYNNKSIRSMNNGLQGYLTSARKKYSERDWKILENLRLRWITQVSTYLGVDPFMKLNLNDKETMFSVLCAIAKQESGSTLGRNDLEAAWQLFKGEQ